MNTTVTRGRAELVVTATGMATEIGRIAGMLHEAEPEPTPLQRQIDALSRTLAVIAGRVIVVVFVLGLVRGQDFGELFVSAVSLAVAAIPEGLPAVVAFTLAMGTARLARRGAIVKRLASVETLGSTSQICTDKTGTLTLNQMTARELRLAGRRFTVSGEGYSTEGRIRTTDGSPLPATVERRAVRDGAVHRRVLRDGEVVGDPTEGALVVLAEKGGIDVAALRQERPRLLEVPFDSDYKFMATFHRWTDEQRPRRGAVLRQGRPGRAGRARRPLPRRHRDPAARRRRARALRRGQRRRWPSRACGCSPSGAQDFAADGLRGRPTTPRTCSTGSSWSRSWASSIRPVREARQAIAECRDAGIRVRMITGDHAVTAGAIAADLGIPGEAVTGDGSRPDRRRRRARPPARRHRRRRPGLPRAQDPHRAGAAGAAATWSP